MKKVLLLCCVVVVSACSASEAAGPIALSSFPAELANAYCAYARNCISNENDAPLTQHFLSASSSCAQDFLRLSPATTMPRLMDAIADGTVTYDAVQARACVDAIASTCNVVFDPTLFEEGPCAKTFVGTLPVNAQCHTQAQCAGDAYCSLNSGVCPASCVQRLAPGTACNNDFECAHGDGLFGACIEGGEGSFHCASVAVAPDAGEGAQCGDVVAGNHIVRTACGAGLFCPHGGGTCRRAHAVGESCVVESDYACTQGALCMGSPSAQCRAVEVVESEGAACDDMSDSLESYRLCNPLHGLVCTSGMCMRSSSGEVGARCSTSGLLLTCQSGLVCNASTSSCVEPAPAGATCYSDVECESGACDQTGTHLCVAAGCGA